VGKIIIILSGVIAVLCGLVLAQDSDDEKRIKELIQSLQSDDFKTREKVTDELIGFGEKAKKFLEEAKKSNDDEVRGRAEYILKIIPVKEKLPERFWKEIPDVVKKLASDDINERLEPLKKFLHIDKEKGEEKPEYEVTDKELDAVFEVLNCDATLETKLKIMRFASKMELGWRIIVKFLDDEDKEVRKNTIATLMHLQEKDTLKALKQRLGKEKDLGMRDLLSRAIQKIQTGKDPRKHEPLFE
jgi:hypothetical protein